MSVEQKRPELDPAALDRLDAIGGPAFVVEMIELFLENAPQRIAAGRRALEVGDWRGVYRATHSLKSTAANLGASRLRELAEEAEERAPERDEAALLTLLDELEEQFGRVEPHLRAERDRRKGSGAGE